LKVHASLLGRVKVGEQDDARGGVGLRVKLSCLEVVGKRGVSGSTPCFRLIHGVGQNRIPGKLAVKPTLPVGISCQHAREVAVFTAPHKDRAAAHLCGALNSLQRYIRAARAGRDRCIPQCVRNISPQPSWLNLAPSPISCYWNASRFSVVDPLTQKRASSLSPGSSLFAD
jgi:hypothetical protein